MARLNKILILLAVFTLAACAPKMSPDPTTSLPPPPAAWLDQIKQQAIASGVSPATVHAALDNFIPNPRVVELDRKQPETTITFAAYRHNTISAARINKGADLMRLYAPELAAAEMRSGVPAQMIVALWGIESSFGQNMGSFETVNSLATLAYEGRRADFFRSELIAALHILDQEHMSSHDLRGSWAGAMGQCQFMPSTYLKYAVDGDGQGRRDIWTDPADVIASIANYLAAEGWQRNIPWGREVNPGDATSSDAGLTQSHSLAEWFAKGVTTLDGQPLPDEALQASLLQPDGDSGPSFLVTDNLRALMRWNRSTYFALSAGLLSDAVNQQ